jgi:predicted dehydrogenase
MMGVGIIGCGDVSHQYFEGLRRYLESLTVVACADQDAAQARSKARDFEIQAAQTPDDLLRNPAVELVVNLTPPAAHAEVTLAAIRNRKHVYSEKPLATTSVEAKQIIDSAERAGVRVGCAPDTFLGGGLQTARKLVEDGWIGRPLSAVGFFTKPGYEHFHPNVEFFYQPGGGPMLDVGPYYVTALIGLFGPAVRVSGTTSSPFKKRRMKVGPRRGQDIDVSTPTHVTGAIEFASGACATLMTSWDVWATTLPYIEVYGSIGSLSMPNPDEFDGQVRLRLAGEVELRQPPLPQGSVEWKEIPLLFDGSVERGIGIADMVDAIASNRPHRASAELAAHVLEILTAFERSHEAGRHIELETTSEVPPALPASLAGNPLVDFEGA